MKNSLMRWLRADSGLQLFPREVGLKRETVGSLDEFLEYVSSCQRLNVDCYASVFSKMQIEGSVFDTIFLDVDDMQSAAVVRDVLEGNGLVAREYCSGRGLHFYIDFEPVKIVDYKNVVRRFVSEVLGLSKYVDMHVVGDVRRMARVPLTYNTKVCRTMSIIYDECYLNRDLPKALERLRMSEPITAEYEERVVDVFKKTRLPPCIEKLIETVVETGELDHHERLILATYLLHNFSFEDVKKLFMLCSDYTEEKTMYQLRWLIDNKYEPYSCRRVKELGDCPLKGGVCEWFPWLGRAV